MNTLTINPMNVSRIADRLKQNVKAPAAANLKKEECEFICNESRKILLAENTVLDLVAPAIIVGDIHGQFQDLIHIFEDHGLPDLSSKKYLFLGDYVDRGKHSIETITLLLAYKCIHKDRFYLLRGNHETRMINSEYGFRTDFKTRGWPEALWELYNSVFDCMPLCAFVAGIGYRIFCTHGGLSPVLVNPQTVAILRRVQKPIEIPDYGVFCDLLWADPAHDIEPFVNNDRGISCYFSDSAVESFCQANKVNYIVRAHQVKDAGFEWFNPQLVTIFSAPLYADGQYTNDGAVLYAGCSSTKITIIGIQGNTQ